jgi:hypothetical protein
MPFCQMCDESFDNGDRDLPNRLCEVCGWEAERVGNLVTEFFGATVVEVIDHF